MHRCKTAHMNTCTHRHRNRQTMIQVDVLKVPIMATSVRTVDSAHDLGVIVHSHLTMMMHVSAVCRATLSTSAVASVSMLAVV